MEEKLELDGRASASSLVFCAPAEGVPFKLGTSLGVKKLE